MGVIGDFLLSRGTSGPVSFDATSNVATTIDTDAFISVAEGPRDEISATGLPSPAAPTAAFRNGDLITCAFSQGVIWLLAVA